VLLYRDSVEPSNKVTGHLTGPAGDEVWASGNVDVEGAKVWPSFFFPAASTKGGALTLSCACCCGVCMCHRAPHS
jgi:hypothetical protein